MASTRSTTRARRTALPSRAKTPKQALVALFRHGARTQIAATTAAATTFLSWAETAHRLAQEVGDELLRRVDGESDSTELGTRIAAAGGAHLRDLSALPRVAADHFEARMARAPIDIKEVR